MAQARKAAGGGEGFVLNFSDRTYAEFFLDFRVDIEAAQFRVGAEIPVDAVFR